MANNAKVTLHRLVYVVDVVENTIRNTLNQESSSSSNPTKTKRSIPVTSLDHNTVRRYFGLEDAQSSDKATKVNKLWDIPDKYFLTVPSHLVTTMEEFDSLTRFSDRSLPLPGETMTRCLVDQILYAAISQVRKELKGLESNNQEHLYLTIETRLEVTLSREDEDLTITGDADYSFWYGDPREMSTNLVVCEAKRLGEAGSGYHQLLGYMGIVHTMRRRLGKKNCVVYGLLTDVRTWRFYRIDSNSRISEWGATWEEEPSKIFSYICFTLRSAYELTPTTSRITPSHRFSAESAYFNFDIFFKTLVEARNLA